MAKHKKIAVDDATKRIDEALMAVRSSVGITIDQRREWVKHEAIERLNWILDQIDTNSPTVTTARDAARILIAVIGGIYPAKPIRRNGQFYWPQGYATLGDEAVELCTRCAEAEKALIPFAQGHATQADVDKLRDERLKLAAWAGMPSQQKPAILRTTTDSPAKRPAKKRRRGGSAPRFDSLDDARTAEKWRVVSGRAGQSMKEFAESLGRPFEKVKQAIDRDRKRQQRRK